MANGPLVFLLHAFEITKFSMSTSVGLSRDGGRSPLLLQEKGNNPCHLHKVIYLTRSLVLRITILQKSCPCLKNEMFVIVIDHISNFRTKIAQFRITIYF